MPCELFPKNRNYNCPEHPRDNSQLGSAGIHQSDRYGKGPHRFLQSRRCNQKLAACPFHVGIFGNMGDSLKSRWDCTHLHSAQKSGLSKRTPSECMYSLAGMGGTYAHKNIAFEFGSAISPVFKLYLLKEYQRLKEDENDRLKLEWDAKRFLSKSKMKIMFPLPRSPRLIAKIHRDM